MRIYWTCTSSYFFTPFVERLIGFQLPYWNELADAGKFAASPVLLDFGGNGSEEDDWAVIDGPFANLTRYLGYGTTNTKHLLTRRVNETASLERGQTYVDTVLTQETFSGFKTALGILCHRPESIRRTSWYRRGCACSSIYDDDLLSHYLLSDGRLCNVA